MSLGWIVNANHIPFWKHRLANVQSGLQGIHPARFTPIDGMSRGMMDHAVGNAMSGNVVHRLFARVLWSMGFAVVDKWADPLDAVALLQ